jgi:hypothetical protein
MLPTYRLLPLISRAGGACIVCERLVLFPSQELVLNGAAPPAPFRAPVTRSGSSSLFHLSGGNRSRARALRRRWPSLCPPPAPRQCGLSPRPMTFALRCERRGASLLHKGGVRTCAAQVVATYCSSSEPRSSSDVRGAGRGNLLLEQRTSLEQRRE